MFTVMAYVWLIIGGLLEPTWILAMKKSNSFRDRKWAAIAAVLIVASPYFLSLSMSEGIPVGTAYAVWTGIGAIGAIVLGALLYKESVEKRCMFFVFLIIIGAVGLGLGGV
ncbi:MAG: QacE family quaternary ammonium compound efflux SMR transporter [Candidatus Methanoplasma sp.]|jgi:quaternary ammonium compound-resistance protein SugE|nr:QacE family quaternary ammonium compound efflux SMR transporter [Candidatus Methanoplasma sp.]